MVAPLKETKFAYEFGKRWDVRTPRGSVKLAVGNLSACCTDQAVTDYITTRMQPKPGKVVKNGNGEPLDPACLAKLTREAVAYALLCHKANREIYRMCTL